MTDDKKKLENDFTLMSAALKEAQHEISTLKHDWTLMREALEFYGDKQNWGETTPDMRDWYLIETSDRETKARTTLAQLKHKEEKHDSSGA